MKAVQKSIGRKDERKGRADAFVYSDFVHPWARIHDTHEVWHVGELTAFCRRCGKQVGGNAPCGKGAIA